MTFRRLFEPINIGQVAIKNRIAMAPMGIIGLVDREGGLTQRAIDYFTERALGGVGLIIVGVTRASDIELLPGLPYVSLQTRSSFAELAESVHYYGTKIFVQFTAGFGRVLFGSSIDGGVQPIAASALAAYWRPDVITRALETDEVEGIARALGNAAKLLREAGIDGIELHGHEGYLLDQFATAIWNKRTDKYGGNLEDRLTFPIEVLNAIKEQAGRDFPVVYRYGLKHYIKGLWAGTLKHENYVEAGRDVAEGLEMAKLLEKAGYDALHVDAGCYDSWYWAHPPTYLPHGCLVDMAEQAKGVVDIPVITVGRLGIPELAEQVLKEKKADIVALGRALLADPHWPKKVHGGQLEEIRPCLGCHECVYRMLVEHKPLSCAVNPATGRERAYVLERVEKPKRVLVIGGGIAGMEAARVAAIKGCQVTLYEKGEKLGGHLIAASVPDFKQDVKRLLDWYNTQLTKLGVEVKLNTEVTPELIKREKPDRVIVATGSTSVIPDVPGIDNPIVVTCIDLLLGKKEAGEKVVVIGGGLVGCEVALWLANQGKKVTVVEALPEMAEGIYEANRVMLLDMLKDKNVELLTNTRLKEIIDEGVKVIDTDFREETLLCDTVALAMGLEPCAKLFESLRGDITEVYLVGDAKEPRKIMHALWDGYHIAAR